MGKKRVLVDIDDRITDEEIRDLMAKAVAISDRDKGVSANFYTKCAVTLLPGQEVIVALRQGDAFDPIVQVKTNWPIPAGPMVGFFILIPIKDV